MGENLEIISKNYLSLLKGNIVEMQWTLNRRKCGVVRMAYMKLHKVLKALSSLQAHSKNLKLYVQIGLLEQGKVSGVK